MSVTLGYVIVYVPDVAAAVQFYEAAFGLEARFVTPENDYGELETGATVLAFASQELASSNLDDAGGFAPLSPEERPPGMVITLLTDDVAGILASCVEAGGRLYADPVEKPWGQTVAYVVDPFGALVEVATPVAAG